METQVHPVLRITFLVHAIVAWILGLALLLIPATFGSALGYTVLEPATWRLLGAALIGFGTSSVLAYRQKIWEKVKIVVQMEVVWCVLGVLVMLWGLFYAGLPVAFWINTLILGVFAVVFGALYYRE